MLFTPKSDLQNSSKGSLNPKVHKVHILVKYCFSYSFLFAKYVTDPADDRTVIHILVYTAMI
jgi:hypothetical protein